MKNLNSTKSRVILTLAFVVVLLGGLIPAAMGVLSGKHSAHADNSGWTTVPSPNITSAYNSLLGVTATSASDAWAVGGASVNNNWNQLSMHWDGSQWILNNFQDTADPVSLLISVAAISPNDVWAVGYGGSASDGFSYGSHPLIEHYVNGVWSVVNAPVLNGSLWGVAAVSPTSVWAVGFDVDTNNELIEHWNGSSWSVIPPPARTTSGALLHSVAVVSADNIWAVGTSNEYGRTGQAIADYWDGTSWVAKDPPVLTDGNGAVLSSASAIPSTGVVWAAGTTWGNGANLDPQIIGYFANGKWNAVTDTVSQGYSYNAVAASASEVDVMTYQSTAEKYISGNWQSVPVEGSLSGSHLWGMNVVPGASSFWAVGDSGDGSTHIEQYSPTSLTPTVTPSPSPSPTTTVTPDPSPTSSPTPGTHKLFVLLLGLATDSKLKDNDFYNGGIVTALKKSNSGAEFLNFSYRYDKNNNPQPYSCGDTFSHHISYYVAELWEQIISYLQKHPGTQVYLIGHSMGGAIAFGLLAFMYQHGYIHIKGGQIAGVVTMDSPLGGVPDFNGIYTGIAEGQYKAMKGCQALNNKGVKFNSLDDLTKIYNPISDPLGGQDSLMSVVDKGSASNQGVADSARSKGISVMTVENVADFVYDFGGCPGFGSFPDNQFLSTQRLADEGDNSGVYGRLFESSPALACDNIANMTINHGKAFTDAGVQEGILQFTSGQTPSALSHS